MSGGRVADLQDGLLGWALLARRELPWRRTRDPWAVLVSEVMLQQTQVARVAPRYRAFLARFPTPSACAAAPAGDVLRLWEGLGYNRRALQLQRAAQAVVERHGGVVPRDLAALTALPGVGAYTARAVMAFAFEADHGIVDTNAARVLARAAAGRRLNRAEAQALADSLVPPGEAWAWNQAVLDLGATVCTRRAPRCGACPVAGACAWMASGRAEPDPAQGTAGASVAQAGFAGSDRQGRGRLVDALRRGPVHLAVVDHVLGWPGEPERVARVVDGLLAEGMVERVATTLRLPR